MITILNDNTYGWEAAVRGMRNPMNSWEKSDSEFYHEDGAFHDILLREKSGKLGAGAIIIGKNDLALMSRLARAGSVEGKFRRMIVVSCDIIAPLYWWKEFDTYKVGTVTNSCSTMHKIHEKEFEIFDFSYEHLSQESKEQLLSTIRLLNQFRYVYNNWDSRHSSGLWYGITTREDAWWNMIQLLPSSYNQKRTVMLNYEVLANIYLSRKNHKLDEWREFCKWIVDLPYSELIIG